MSAVPAGWYDDGAGGLRWWDGQQWTDRLARVQEITAPAATEPQPVVDQAQPVVAEPQPVADQAQPVVAEPQPVVDQAQPAHEPVVPERQPRRSPDDPFAVLGSAFTSGTVHSDGSSGHPGASPERPLMFDAVPAYEQLGSLGAQRPVEDPNSPFGVLNKPFRSGELKANVGGGQPYGRSAAGPSDYSRAMYIVLALLLGALGIHNFYAKRNGPGTGQLLMTLLVSMLFHVIGIATLTLGWSVAAFVVNGIVAIWVLANIVTVEHDGYGRRLK